MATRKRSTKRTKRSKRSIKGGVHHQPHRHTMKLNRHVSAPRLSHMGVVGPRRKLPFKSSAIPVRNVMGAIQYGHLNPHGENMMMRSVSARSAMNRSRRQREKKIKEDINFEKEYNRLMKEAIKKNEENAEVDRQTTEMIHEANMNNIEKAMKHL